MISILYRVLDAGHGLMATKARAADKMTTDFAAGDPLRYWSNNIIENL